MKIIDGRDKPFRIIDADFTLHPEGEATIEFRLSQESVADWRRLADSVTNDNGDLKRCLELLLERCREAMGEDMRKKVSITLRMIIDSDNPVRDAQKIADQIVHQIKFEDTLAYDIKVKDISAGVDFERFDRVNEQSGS